MPTGWREKHVGPPYFRAVRAPCQLSLSAADFPLTPTLSPQSGGEGHYGGGCTEDFFPVQPLF